MKAIYHGNTEINEGGKKRQKRSVELPFDSVTVKTILVRRRDGFILGMLFSDKDKYTLPGGVMNDSEKTTQAADRILEDNGIILEGPDIRWRERISVDYFSGHRSLSVSYVIVVEGAQWGENEEVTEMRWLDQTQDVWHPVMREKICIAIQENALDLLKVHVSVLESW